MCFGHIFKCFQKIPATNLPAFYNHYLSDFEKIESAQNYTLSNNCKRGKTPFFTC